MRHTLNTLIAIAISLAALHGATVKEVPWTSICNANGPKLRVTTADGRHLQGSCTVVEKDTIVFEIGKGQSMLLERSNIAKVEISPRRQRQLTELRQTLGRELSGSVKDLFTPMAPLALVAIPAELAWGAISTPFCAIGDLLQEDDAVREVNPI